MVVLSELFDLVCPNGRGAERVECFLRDTKGGTVCYRNAAQHTATVAEWRANRYGLLLAPVDTYDYDEKAGLLYATLR